jgi:ribonuclease HI
VTGGALLRSVSSDLNTWSREVLGDMEKRIKELNVELEECRRSPLSQNIVNKEQIIRFKLERLEEQRDIYWRQRAHVQWLEKGDRNTHYFHSCASERKRKNTIHKLKGEDGRLVEGNEGLQELITNYYVSLFTPIAGIDIRHALSHIPARVTPQMNEALQAEYTAEEVKNALDGMGDLKAPGADGMPAIFFKRYWPTVGEQVVNEVLHVLRGGSIPEGWNETIVVLIPKVQNPEKLKDLRPISLCNVVYKLISKVLANRLKKILGDLISPNQSAFVPGRLISDNTILAYEMYHFMRKQKRGRKHYMAVKLDMSKAYDRVEWPFLRGVMEKLGFCGTFIELVMKCVSTVSYKFKINGQLSEAVVPGRGLRQGDPISPYLFLLCAEGFSGLLHYAQANGDIKGIRLAPSAPAVNHLLFADDSLLLMEANHRSAAAVNSLLQTYEECSGQQINRDKSVVSFSPSTPRGMKEELKWMLGLQTETHGGKYLGLPLFVGRSKVACFEYLKERIWKRIQGWKENFLSSAGKEILIKAVAQAIPTYAMACFDLTKSLCDSIAKMVCQYWWSQQEKEHPMHWVSWEKMTLPKADGGLGFRNLYSFNLAMLARQGWRLIQSPDSLCAKVLKAIYFPDCDMFSAVPKPGISYVWRSVLKGIQLLKEGLIWRVGDGKCINIWQDPWLPKDETCRVTSQRGNSILTKVAELINPVSGTWDHDLVKQTFNPEEANIILAIPIVDQVDDFLAWHRDNRGIFTVKSAYKLHVELQLRQHRSFSGPSPDQSAWKKLWKMPCPPKVMHFLWRFGHNSHPLYMNIERRGVELDTRCPICCRLFEDGGHLFLRCKWVKKLWAALELEAVRDKLCQCKNPVQILYILQTLAQDDCIKSIALLWCWWQERNKHRHGECKLDIPELQFLIMRHADEWRLLAKKEKDLKVEKKIRWKPPPVDWVKINIDGAFSERSGSGGWGVIARDDTGDAIFAAAGAIPAASEALHSELMALVNAIPIAESQGMGKIIFSTDCMILKQAMESTVYDLSSLGSLVVHIKFLLATSFISFKFEHVPRACNKPAHELAALGARGELDSFALWFEDLPPDVCNMVAGDLAGPY